MKKVRQPTSAFAKDVGKALDRAAKRARVIARQHGTPIYVISKGVIVALKP